MRIAKVERDLKKKRFKIKSIKSKIAEEELYIDRLLLLQDDLIDGFIYEYKDKKKVYKFKKNLFKKLYKKKIRKNKNIKIFNLKIKKFLKKKTKILKYKNFCFFFRNFKRKKEVFSIEKNRFFSSYLYNVYRRKYLNNTIKLEKRKKKSFFPRFNLSFFIKKKFLNKKAKSLYFILKKQDKFFRNFRHKLKMLHYNKRYLRDFFFKIKKKSLRRRKLRRCQKMWLNHRFFKEKKKGLLINKFDGLLFRYNIAQFLNLKRKKKFKKKYFFKEQPLKMPIISFGKKVIYKTKKEKKIMKILRKRKNYIYYKMKNLNKLLFISNNLFKFFIHSSSFCPKFSIYTDSINKEKIYSKKLFFLEILNKFRNTLKKKSKKKMILEKKNAQYFFFLESNIYSRKNLMRNIFLRLLKKKKKNVKRIYMYNFFLRKHKILWKKKLKLLKKKKII